MHFDDSVESIADSDLEDGELFVNDVRVSPEGAGVVEEDELPRAARRPRTGASGPPPRSRRTTPSRRREACTTWVPGGPPSWGTLGPFRVRRTGSRSVTAW